MQDTFQWTDESVSEFIMERFVRFSSEFMQMHIDEFKSSKAPKKEWEIVAYGEIYEGEKLMYKLQPSGGYRNEDWECDIEYDATQFNNPNEFIHSVRRLSDGEVFSVGDRTNNGFIRGFKIGVSENGVLDNNQIYVTCVATVGDEFPCAGLSLRFIKKVVAPLFTTLDGVALQENEWCWVVDKHYNLLPESEKINEFKKNYYSNCFIFSTREAAENYVIRHKPCLSVEDVRYVLESIQPYTDARNTILNVLTTAVKSKL